MLSWFRKTWGLKKVRAVMARASDLRATPDEEREWSKRIDAFFAHNEEFNRRSRERNGPATRGIRGSNSFEKPLNNTRTLYQQPVVVPGNLRGTRRGLFGALVGTSLVAMAAPAYANTPFTSFAFPGGAPPGGSASPTSRTTPARIADIYNVKEYGALGNGAGGAGDTAAIQAAFAALWASSYNGTLYFPPGIYTVNAEIDIGHINGAGTAGRIVGAGRSSTGIIGTVDDGFIFAQADNPYNGPEEISSMAIVNNSVNPGTGAIRMNNTSVVIRQVRLGGQVNILFPFNVYDAVVDNCLGGSSNSDPTNGYNGTFGIAGYQCHVRAWRSTNPYTGAIMMWGANGSQIADSGIENSVTGVGFGFKFGWASACTISGTTLTVGGTMGSTVEPQFEVGATIFMQGVTMPVWGTDPVRGDAGVTITGLGTGVGYAGTYTISAPFTISSPVPCLTREESHITSGNITNLQTEACWNSIYVANIASGIICNTGGGTNALQAVNQFGVVGSTPFANVVIGNATSLTGYSISCGGATINGSIYIRSDSILSNVVFINCLGAKQADIVTDNTSTISNGSGGSGDILEINAIASAGTSIGVGMPVTGSGTVTAGTVITGSYYNDSALRTNTTVNAVVVGSQTNTTFTVSSVTNGKAIRVGDIIIASGYQQYPNPGTAITAQLTGTPGGAGTYSTNVNQNVGSQSGIVCSRAGTGGLGVYRVNNAQNRAAQTITVAPGPDWTVPSSTNANQAGMRFMNCGGVNPSGVSSGLNNFNMTFAYLPGQASCNTAITLLRGMSFFITDGAKSGGGTATPGDNVQGGGSQKIPVFYDGTDWKYGGQGQFL
jgi:hypothetical protein